MPSRPRKFSDLNHVSDALPRPIKRHSLVTQAIESIRQHLHLGTWDRQLPGERQLCELLLVSRPTIRRALMTLEKEGILEVSRGKHRLIKQQRIQNPSRTEAISEVIILSRDAASQMTPSTLYLIDETYKRLQKAGYKLTVQSPPWLLYKKPEVYLERHVKAHPSACWALFSTSEAVQKWFSANSNRAMVPGSCYPSATLPCIDLDYRAIMNHAVGTLLRCGYRNLTMFLPEVLRPGDNQTVAAFQDAVKRAPHANVTGRFLRVSANRETFTQNLKEHLQTDAPIGLYISKPLDVLYVISYLLSKGVAIGKDIGIISGGDEQYLHHLIQRPACYRIDNNKFATKFGQQLLKLIQTGSLPARPTLMMPDFVPGDTI